MSIINYKYYICIDTCRVGYIDFTLDNNTQEIISLDKKCMGVREKIIIYISKPDLKVEKVIRTKRNGYECSRIRIDFSDNKICYSNNKELLFNGNVYTKDLVLYIMPKLYKRNKLIKILNIDMGSIILFNNYKCVNSDIYIAPSSIYKYDPEGYLTYYSYNNYNIIRE